MHSLWDHCGPVLLPVLSNGVPQLKVLKFSLPWQEQHSTEAVWCTWNVNTSVAATSWQGMHLIGNPLAWGPGCPSAARQGVSWQACTGMKQRTMQANRCCSERPRLQVKRDCNERPQLHVGCHHAQHGYSLPAG